MGWRVIYVEESDYISLYLDNLKIKHNVKGEITIPLLDIHTLIIDNIKITITVQLLNKCADYNINVVMCAITHMPHCLNIPIAGHHSTYHNTMNQLSWSKEKKGIMHKIIVKNKIRNQWKLLKFLNKNELVIEKLKTFENEVNISDNTNREGLAAKMYFRELYGENFIRFSDDVINAGLNYGYAILRSQISKTIYGKGLNPLFGIIHYGPNNHFNLSDDLIEVFRPLIDCYCFKYILNSILFKKEHRIGLVETTTKYATFGNTNQSIFNTISFYLDSIISFFANDDITKIQEISLIYEEV